MDKDDELAVAKVGDTEWNNKRSELSYEETIALTRQRNNKSDNMTEKKLEKLEIYQEDEQEAKA